MGVGLTQSLLAVMGGTFTILDVPKGTMVQLSVPASLASKQRHQSHEACSQAPLKVMVVDDNPINLQVLVAQLSSLKCDCSTASDGAEAYELFREKSFDMIFMDCQMPVMDGLQATRAIRKFEANRDDAVPIIAVTANVMSEHKKQCFEAGMDHFLAKPVNNQQLLDLLTGLRKDRLD